MPSRRELFGALDSLIRLIENADSLTLVRRGSTYHHAVSVAAEEKRGQIAPIPWTSFEPTSAPEGLTQSQKDMLRQHMPEVTNEEADRLFEKMIAEHEVYVNSRYQVAVKQFEGGTVHLSIKRLDQLPIHDWRDLQRIKNELIGENCEFVELYPAEDRRADTSNQYHLFGSRDPKVRFPFGYDERLVTDAESGGAAQRPRDDET